MKIVKDPRFIETRGTVPPGGMWVFDLNGDHVESPVYDIAVKKVGELLEKHNIKAPAAAMLAAYMCPRMPDGFCTGEVVHEDKVAIFPAQAKENAYDYLIKQVETIDVIRKRLQTCVDCPMHVRTFCLHCGGWDKWIYDGLGGRRPRVPEDDASGCCACAKTFEALLASVVYDKDDKIWEGVPDTCWRKHL